MAAPAWPHRQAQPKVGLPGVLDVGRDERAAVDREVDPDRVLGRHPVVEALRREVVHVVELAEDERERVAGRRQEGEPEDRFRGRIMSLYTLMFVGTAPIGALTSGWIAQRWGAPLATSFSAMVLLGGALWMSYRLRVIAARESAVATPSPGATEKMG